MLDPDTVLQLERVPHREQSVFCVMLNYFFGLSTTQIILSIASMKTWVLTSLGVMATGVYVTKVVYYGQLSKVDDLDQYSGNET
jgi:hypothetical protein